MSQAQTSRTPRHATRPWKNSISTLVSMLLHIVLLLVLALVSIRWERGVGEAEEVLIGTLPGETFADGDATESLSASAEADTLSDPLLDELSLETPDDPLAEFQAENMEFNVNPITSGGTTNLDIAASTTGSRGGGGDWEGLLKSLRRDGLDIVITFDSTGSMSGEIYEVKNQIRRIGSTLLQLVPKARISLCTYRDLGDDYLVRGLPLTRNLAELEDFLSKVRARGGGDYPEAVNEGLRWAIENNSFQATARKVILIFGDAPPHPRFQDACLRMASDFHRNQKGIVSTVTCRAKLPLPQFASLARAGRGESFLTRDEREIMTQLIVLVFGSRHRNKVLEAFRLLEQDR